MDQRRKTLIVLVCLAATAICLTGYCLREDLFLSTLVPSNNDDSGESQESATVTVVEDLAIVGPRWKLIIKSGAFKWSVVSVISVSILAGTILLVLAIAGYLPPKPAPADRLLPPKTAPKSENVVENIHTNEPNTFGGRLLAYLWDCSASLSTGLLVFVCIGTAFVLLVGFVSMRVLVAAAINDVPGFSLFAYPTELDSGRTLGLLWVCPVVAILSFFSGIVTYHGAQYPLIVSYLFDVGLPVILFGAIALISYAKGQPWRAIAAVQACYVFASVVFGCLATLIGNVFWSVFGLSVLFGALCFNSRQNMPST